MRRVLTMCALVAAAAVVPAMPATAGGYCADPGQYQDRATSDVVMKGDCFGPTVARVEVGDEVTFRNVDPRPHTVGGVAGTFGDAHREVPGGESVAYRFEDEGVYPFFCVLHPGMAGAIVVGDGQGEAVGTSVANPVEPASATSEKSTSSAPSGIPFPMVAGIAVAVGALGALGATVVLRRRRAVGAAA